ncbi:MAG TPA: hypothetical protein VJP87_02230 [Candidatus Acidoferrales bacterium]|nr:hypothetical protein [Candidatus Acidoferrales bacterium]
MLEPKAARWLSFGLLLVALSIALPHLVHASRSFSQDSFDAVRGLLVGIGIGIEVVALFKFNRRRRIQ